MLIENTRCLLTLIMSRGNEDPGTEEAYLKVIYNEEGKWYSIEYRVECIERRRLLFFFFFKEEFSIRVGK